MTDIVQPMRYKIDVRSVLQETPLHGVLMRGDKNANRIIVELVDGDTPVPLDGVTVTGKFFRGGDAVEIALTGSANGNLAEVELNAHCYAVEGNFRASVRLGDGEARRTILTLYGRVIHDGEGGILDVEHVIPSVEDIVAQYQRMQEVTQQTESAGNAATAAASAATGASKSATAAAQSATAAAGAANTAANAANAAAARLDGMTATATGLPAGSAPTVAVTTGEDGAKRLDFGIPEGKKGDTGATPQLTVTAKTGEPGTEVSAVQGGTAENPTLELTIPRGETGHGVPDGGSKGQVLTVGDSGAVWADPTASVEVDATLTQEGQAADAKAVGDGLSQLKSDLADAWTSGKTYAVGDYCISGNRLYKCKTAHTAGSSLNADYWDAVNIAGEVKNKLSSNQFVNSPFDPGTTYSIEFAENYSNSAIIFGCYGGGKGFLITYGNGYIWNANPNDEVEVTDPTGADNYRSIRIKNATTGGYGYIGVISIGQSVGITAI